MLCGNDDAALFLLSNFFDKEPYLFSRFEIQIRSRLIHYNEFSISYKSHCNREFSFRTWRYILYLFVQFYRHIYLFGFHFDNFLYLIFFVYTSEVAYQLKVLPCCELIEEEVILLAEADVGSELLRGGSQ